MHQVHTQGYTFDRFKSNVHRLEGKALVDSSLWVHQLRKSGDPAKRDRVNALLESGEAAWCPPVRFELWRGVTNDAERKTLRRYEGLLQIGRASCRERG